MLGSLSLICPPKWLSTNQPAPHMTMQTKSMPEWVNVMKTSSEQSPVYNCYWSWLVQKTDKGNCNERRSFSALWLPEWRSTILPCHSSNLAGYLLGMGEMWESGVVVSYLQLLLFMIITCATLIMVMVMTGCLSYMTKYHIIRTLI